MNYKVNLEDLTPSSSGTTFMFTKKQKNKNKPIITITTHSLRKRLYYLVVPLSTMKCNNTLKRERKVCIWVACVIILVWNEGHGVTNAFQVILKPARSTTTSSARRTVHCLSSKNDDIDLSATKSQIELLGDNSNSSSDNNVESFIMTPTTGAAKTGTVNERLIAELQQATLLEKSGITTSSSVRNGKSNKLSEAASFFKSSKTDAERRAAIAEAQDLNGVNPITTLFGAIFALACAVGLWLLTQTLAAYFALHPSDSDIYFVERVTLLSRNIIMGLSALASGFFGVTGIGILLLAIRVGYGVVTGELDPTPIVSSNQSNKAGDDNMKVDMSNVWDMMMNKSTKKGPR